MERYELLVTLSLFTLVAVLIWAIWQRYRVSQAKQDNEHSALTTNREDRPQTRPVERDRPQARPAERDARG